MRQLLFRALQRSTRALRPADRRRPQRLGAGSTVLYLQFETPLGCCVHGTPLIEALRACAPGVRIAVASRGTGAAILAHHPGVDLLHDSRTNPFESPGAMWTTIEDIRRWLRELGLRPDWIISDASNRRTGSALLAALLRLAPTAGFADTSELYDIPLTYDPGLSLIDNNLRLPLSLGGNAKHREPAVYFTAAELAKAETLLGDLRGSARGRVGFVLQGSGGQRTGWHDERFAEVIRQLEADGYEAVYLGTASDAEGIERVRALSSSSGRSLAGETSIPGAAAVLCLCDLLITVDTGTMHLGRAVGVPMVVLGPSWQQPLEWLPLELENVQILRGPDRNEVPPGYRLDEIAVDAVSAAARELLTRFPPSEADRRARVQARLSNTRP